MLNVVPWGQICNGRAAKLRGRASSSSSSPPPFSPGAQRRRAGIALQAAVTPFPLPEFIVVAGHMCVVLAWVIEIRVGCRAVVQGVGRWVVVLGRVMCM